MKPLSRRDTLCFLVALLPVAFTRFAHGAECPTTSTCPQCGQTGNPTGQYKWQGSVEFAQFRHETMSGTPHIWWDRCA
jgi:hypothetical protein